MQKCCCFDSVTGGLIIGWLRVIVAASIVLVAFLLSNELPLAIVLLLVAWGVIDSFIYGSLIVGINKVKCLHYSKSKTIEFSQKEI